MTDAELEAIEKAYPALLEEVRMLRRTDASTRVELSERAETESSLVDYVNRLSDDVERKDAALEEAIAAMKATDYEHLWDAIETCRAALAPQEVEPEGDETP